MKLRNLFLASLAAMAMVSCSNEDDQIIDSKYQGTDETAALQFTVAFPSASETRTVTGTEENEGTASEQKFNDIYLALEYGDNHPFIHKYTEADFSEPVQGARKASEFINVPAGDATVYVFVNPSQTLAGTFDAIIASQKVTEEGTIERTNKTLDYTMTEGFESYTIDILEGENGIAKGNSFLMTGKKAFVIKANQPNEVSVKVDRVAAKLEEYTQKEAYTIARNNEENQYVDADNKVIEVQVQITDYAYTNLNKTTYVVAQNTPYAVTKENIFQYFGKDLTEKAFVEYNGSTKTITGLVENAGDITYCNENGSTIPTSILYKGQIMIKKEGQDQATTAGTLLVNRDNNVIYMSFEEADKATNGALTSAGLNISSPAKDFAKYGFEKFEDGLCYYNAEIQTAGEKATSEIKRNNWYKLHIVSLKDLGLPSYNPPTPEYPTLFLLGIETNPWLVSTNGFEL